MANKITAAQKAEMYRLCTEEGKTQLEVAAIFDVSTSTVCNTVKEQAGKLQNMNWDSVLKPLRLRIAELKRQQDAIDKEFDDIYRALHNMLYGGGKS